MPRQNPERRQEVDVAITPKIGQRHQTVPADIEQGSFRVSAVLQPGLKLAVEQLSALDKRSIPEIVEDAVEKHVIALQERRTVTATNDKVILENPQEILLLSNLIITAIDDALEYTELSVDRRNRPAPPLLIPDVSEDYLRQLRRLVEELRRLNDNLEYAATAPKQAPKRKTERTPKADAKNTAVHLKRHINTFLNQYATSMGKGAAALTVGTLSALLIRFGVPVETFAALIKNLKP
jgi:hypothetical protein